MDVTNIITMDTISNIMANKEIIGGILSTIILIPLSISFYNSGWTDTWISVNKNILDEEIFINVFINVGLISVFLGIFFFTYAATVEAEIVKMNVKVVTNDLMELIAPALSDDVKQQFLNNLTVPDMKNEDEHVAKSNNKLMSESFAQLIIILDIALTIAFLISTYYKHHFFKTVGFNLIILIFIGLTEFVFINFVARKYISADTNFARYTILTNLKTKIEYAPSITDESKISPSIINNITDLIKK
jgi:hypothetical protein